MLGFRVKHASKVQTALAALALETPDVLLTDCNLPETSGIELIEELRAMDGKFAIIGMSAEHFKGQDMLNAGASAFLEKPLEVEALREALADYV